jgi:uncharacterized protein (DUF169 family)
MDMKFKKDFIAAWQKYFNNAELPITFYYADDESHAELAKPHSIPRCVIGALVKVRQGNSYTFNLESIGCFGGKRYVGFSDKLSSNFEYFLSCGIPGEVEGERYKKTPEIVKNLMERWPKFKAPARFIVFKRWDKLEDTDNPEVVIFFAPPDVLSGLFTLANYEESDPNAAKVPMSSGCASIVQNPYLEKNSEHPHAIIGMFDLSARPFVAPDELTFSVPIEKFTSMVKNMDESFLITKTWKTMMNRIK